MTDLPSRTNSDTNCLIARNGHFPVTFKILDNSELLTTLRVYQR
jgi:hypothetical protein